MDTYSKPLLAVALTTLVACAGTALTRDTLRPIPEHTAGRAGSDFARGSERDARRIAADQEFAIIGEIVRRFFRPMMQQARWIDPRPLAHERSRQADSLVKPDYDWALGIVAAARLRRVCPLTEANQQCRGLAGGALRFSSPYAVGTLRNGYADSALVYARYIPNGGGGESELEFFVARARGAWTVVSKRSMPEIVATAPPAYQIIDPREAVDSLIAADRAFAQAALALDLPSAITSMFMSNVVMQAPGGHVRGRDSASKLLEGTPANAGARMTWTPVKGGVSSDFQHGFTVGYVTVTRPDGTTQPGKYVAYWVRSESGWRVAAYKRVPRPAGNVSLAVLPASLPTKGLPRGDEATVQRYADELSRAEHAFSRDAGPLGLRAAFEKWGAPDAVNTGHAGPEFVRGNQAIAMAVEQGLAPGSTISWAPEQVIVSTTGDLGVSIGTIRLTTPGSADKPETTRQIPFFTIWKRAWPTDPWRYVAE